MHASLHKWICAGESISTIATSQPEMELRSAALCRTVHSGVCGCAGEVLGRCQIVRPKFSTCITFASSRHTFQSDLMKFLAGEGC